MVNISAGGQQVKSPKAGMLESWEAWRLANKDAQTLLAFKRYSLPASQQSEGYSLLRLLIASDQRTESRTVELLIMIFIAGVSPKIKVLDQNPRRCPVCGLNRAFYKRIDHYLSLFFIPIFRVKRGEPFLACDHCEQSLHPPPQDFKRPQSEDAWVCRYCGKTLDKDFKYCPHCGKRV